MINDKSKSTLSYVAHLKTTMIQHKDVKNKQEPSIQLNKSPQRQ